MEGAPAATAGALVHCVRAARSLVAIHEGSQYATNATDAAGNPLNRYLLNSAMLPQFKKDADGGLTLLIQNESPGADNEANWLPAPKGPFIMFMRLYWPKAEALEGKWTAPPLKRVS